MSEPAAGVTAEDLRFGYRRTNAPVIDGFSYRFAAGTLTSLVGASGSGKSTLLYLLALMLKPTAGRIEWRGQSTQDMRDDRRAQLRAAHSGFVFQDAVLDPSRSVLDNVREGGLFAGLDRATSTSRAYELLAHLGLESRAKHRPGQVSGGQAQRVALCRALVSRPSVIFGDEPTGNLDTDSADVVWDELRRQADRGATVIVATHDLARARGGDHTVDLDR